MIGQYFSRFSFISAMFSLAILTGIFFVLTIYAWDAIDVFGLSFFSSSDWQVGADDKGGSFGALIPIAGTIFSTFIAMFIATPIAIGIAIFLTEVAPQIMVKPVSISIELLAAIPSIIYGMWGLFYFAPIIQSLFGGSGIGLLTAGIVLAIMIIPFMAAITRDSMNTTPNVLKESAYALGATKFEVIKDVIIPYAKAGVIGSIILALGRALGETMAIAFLIGSVFRYPEKITDATTSIPVVLANNFAEAIDLELASMFYLALILFLISFLIIFVAKFYFLGDKK